MDGHPQVQFWTLIPRTLVQTRLFNYPNQQRNQASVLYYAIIILCLEYPLLIQEKGKTGRWIHLVKTLEEIQHTELQDYSMDSQSYKNNMDTIKSQLCMIDTCILKKKKKCIQSKKIFQLCLHLSTRNYAPLGQTALKTYPW